MPEAKKSRPEKTKYPSAALVPWAIFNYVITLEEYVSVVFVRNIPKNCKKAPKIETTLHSARNCANDFLSQFFTFFFMQFFSWLVVKEHM